MRPANRNIGAIAGINVQLLLASAFGFVAWASWPDRAEWWGLGVVSVLFGMAAIAGASNALRAVAALYRKDRALADYLAQGGKPKTAELASDDALRRAGMIE